jgi:hypothetical protein
MPLRACLNPIYNQLDWLFAHVNHEQYTTPISMLGGATVGQHVRHILGFLECLVEGATSGVLNYDRRRRDLLIETDAEAAFALFSKLEKEIQELPNNRSLHLEVVVGQHSPLSQHLLTTIDREVMYLSEHSMHHLALIRYGAQAQWPELQFPTDFGFAESTLRARVVA